MTWSFRARSGTRCWRRRAANASPDWGSPAQNVLILGRVAKRQEALTNAQDSDRAKSRVQSLSNDITHASLSFQVNLNSRPAPSDCPERSSFAFFKSRVNWSVIGSTPDFKPIASPPPVSVTATAWLATRKRIVRLFLVQ